VKLAEFVSGEAGIRGVVPEGWTRGGPDEGVQVVRGAHDGDPTMLYQQGFAGLPRDVLKGELMAHAGRPGEPFPECVSTVESDQFTWDLYAPPDEGLVRTDIALGQHDGWIYMVLLVSLADEHDQLYETVYLPAVRALAPALADGAYRAKIEAHADEYRALIRANRDALRNGPWPEFPTLSDQKRGIPMPPAQKAHDENAVRIDLPAADRSIVAKSDLFDCITDRRSRRKYTEGSLSLDELAYLLWATQGVRKVFGDRQGSLRTVPSSGARQPFETYLAVNCVEGLQPGIYRYLPFDHQLVYLFSDDDLPGKLEALSCDQAFVGQGAVCFIWSAVPYREEWRYGTQAYKGILLDAGHVCQNLYLACESIGCGTCAIAAYDQDGLDRFLGLDGEEELVVYLAPVGKVKGSER
jgi:SagB-type dehydrogenase family enzyme